MADEQFHLASLTSILLTKRPILMKMWIIFPLFSSGVSTELTAAIVIPVRIIYSLCLLQSFYSDGSCIDYFSLV